MLYFSCTKFSFMYMYFLIYIQDLIYFQFLGSLCDIL